MQRIGRILTRKGFPPFPSLPSFSPPSPSPSPSSFFPFPSLFKIRSFSSFPSSLSSSSFSLSSSSSSSSSFSSLSLPSLPSFLSSSFSPSLSSLSLVPSSPLLYYSPRRNVSLPRKTKFRKYFKGRVKGVAKRGSKVDLLYLHLQRDLHLYFPFHLHFL